MNHFIKHITLGAVLGLAMLVGGTGQAHALLLGNEIRTTVEFPTIGTVAAGPLDRTVVDPAVEILGFGAQGQLDVDFSDTLIKITLNGPFSFQPATFNGFHFSDLNNSISDWVVSVNAGLTNIVGFGLTFTDNDIFVNGQGLSLNAGDMIALNVAAKPVPEPSTMLLLGTGLVGVIAWRKRAAKA